MGLPYFANDYIFKYTFQSFIYSFTPLFKIIFTMKRYFFTFSFLAMASVLFSCSGNGSNDAGKSNAASNPFFQASNLPYQAPPFDKIKDSDYVPALEEGMKQQLAEVQQIADNTDAPTFENTLVAMEKTGALLNRVSMVFNAVTGANTNDYLQKIQEAVAPKLAAHQDAIYMNEKLFKRIEAINQQKSKLNLDTESARLVDYYYQEFVLNGAQLPDDKKSQMKKLNEEEALLSAKFSNMLLAGAKKSSLAVSDKNELAGLSQGEIDAAAKAASDAKMDGKWLLPLQNTTQQPALQSLTNRATREKLFAASWNRNELSDSNDTRQIVLRLTKIRADKAALLGFADYATWKLQDQMAKTPQAVESFFNQLIPAATAKARGEAQDLQNVIKLEKDTFALQPYDWNFYAEKIRKQKYNLDESEVKQYFVLDSVLQNGVFYAANLLYGITFKERKDIPVYQKDVRVFEVFEENGTPVGLFYCDYFKRDNKSGGAWMDNMVSQSYLLGTKPVIYNVCNFAKPADGQPALISFDDVTTMFHEFGHALHGFFADQKFHSLSGAATPRDFVEFPSQFNEHWALYPSVLTHYAKHYKTQAVIPQTLIDKIKKAATFNQGYALTEIISAADLDMQWHTVKPNAAPTDVDKFEKEALQKTGLNLSEVPPRYRSTYFLHIWANGYAAGYYAYLWTEMLDDDAYSWFEENGGLTRANGQRFRNMVLSRGNTEDFNVLFKNFRGHNPDINPMLKKRGLK
jgi:peptidyl-dipeptidase Dcp